LADYTQFLLVRARGGKGGKGEFKEKEGCALSTSNTVATGGREKKEGFETRERPVPPPPLCGGEEREKSEPREGGGQHTIEIYTGKKGERKVREMRPYDSGAFPLPVQNGWEMKAILLKRRPAFNCYIYQDRVKKKGGGESAAGFRPTDSKGGKKRKNLERRAASRSCRTSVLEGKKKRDACLLIEKGRKKKKKSNLHTVYLTTLSGSTAKKGGDLC